MTQGLLLVFFFKSKFLISPQSTDKCTFFILLHFLFPSRNYCRSHVFTVIRFRTLSSPPRRYRFLLLWGSLFPYSLDVLQVTYRPATKTSPFTSFQNTSTTVNSRRELSTLPQMSVSMPLVSDLLPLEYTLSFLCASFYVSESSSKS